MICFTLDHLFYPIIQFSEQVSHNALSHQFEHQFVWCVSQHAFSARLQNSALRLWEKYRCYWMCLLPSVSDEPLWWVLHHEAGLRRFCQTLLAYYHYCGSDDTWMEATTSLKNAGQAARQFIRRQEGCTFPSSFNGKVAECRYHTPLLLFSRCLRVGMTCRPSS
jgi:hypothetical protein